MQAVLDLLRLKLAKVLDYFLVDTKQIEEGGEGFRRNKTCFYQCSKVIEEMGDDCTFEEGCLSIPDIRGDVVRQTLKYRIKYLDDEFNEHEETFDGINARVIQHEYDHIEGKLFTEKLQPLKKRLIKRKLENIKKGKVHLDYRMRFACKEVIIFYQNLLEFHPIDLYPI